MTKELQKEMMIRSKLKNRFNKERSYINWCNVKRQRNCYLNILRKTKKKYFNSFNIKQVSDNKLFWKSIKPFSSDKEPSSSKITLVQGNNIESNKEEIANIMNNYFINVTKTLNLNKHFSTSGGDPSAFDSHFSIKMIYEKYPEIIPESFNFKLVSDDDVKKKMQNLNIKKSSTHGSIPANVLKQCVDCYLAQLTNSINYSFQHNRFPQEMKLSEVIPLYNKLDPLQNYYYLFI